MTDREELELYAKQLDAISEQIMRVHPIGLVKHIGRLEVAEAVKQVVERMMEGEADQLKCEYNDVRYVIEDAIEKALEETQK